MQTTEPELLQGNPASYIDHTLLRPDTSSEQIAALCEEAVEYGFAAVCVPPAFVETASGLLYGSGVNLCTVVGFPCGYTTPCQKVFEASESVAAGAAEIDMVVQIGQLLAGEYRQVEDEIAQVVLAAEGAEVKVIIECYYLSQEIMSRATEVVVRAGAAYVKTSTGFAPGGARLEDVRLLVQAAAGRVGVKAAGGIRDLTACRQMIAAGASRIGTSAGVAIVEQWKGAQGL